MLTTRIFPAYTSLVSIAQATYATTNVIVYDGPPVAIPTDTEYLVVGCSEEPSTINGPSLAVDGASDWAALGAQARDETFTIHCSYVAWDGGGNFSDVRATAATSIGLLESALRSNIDLTRNLGRGGWSGLAITNITQIPGQEGVGINVLFDVVCRARI